MIENIPVLGKMAGLAEQSLLAIGVMASAIHAAGAAVSRMNFNERNASRFLTTSDNLEFLAETGLDEARICAANGKSENVLAFINAVQHQISSEHQEWILLRDVAPDPVG
jgi:hypothetical protein